MDINYYEQLIKRESNAVHRLEMVGLTGLTLISIVVGFYAHIGFVFAGTLVIADVVWFRMTKIEYEYIFTDGGLDIDRIIAKSSRKRVFSTHIRDIAVMAPSGDMEVKRYSNLKLKDYSSGGSNRTTYEIIAGAQGLRQRIRIEPDEELLEMMHRMSKGNIFSG